MKLSNEELIEKMSNLKVLAQRDLPIKASYAIAKNISKIGKELKIYEEERRKLIEKYAKKDKDGKIVADKAGQIVFEDSEEWEKNITELLSIEVDIDFHKFDIQHLEGCEISPAELVAMEHMIND